MPGIGSSDQNSDLGTAQNTEFAAPGFRRPVPGHKIMPDEAPRKAIKTSTNASLDTIISNAFSLDL